MYWWGRKWLFDSFWCSRCWGFLVVKEFVCQLKYQSHFKSGHNVGSPKLIWQKSAKTGVKPHWDALGWDLKHHFYPIYKIKRWSGPCQKSLKLKNQRFRECLDSNTIRAILKKAWATLTSNTVYPLKGCCVFRLVEQIVFGVYDRCR